MAKIKIKTAPPGFAPDNIREQWIGIEIPLTETPIKNGFRTGESNGDGYQVSGTDAVKALLDAGKKEAADFWKQYASGNFIFKKEVCELIP